jgi:hypothetical protein
MLSTWLKRTGTEKPKRVGNDQVIYAPIVGHRIYFAHGKILYRVMGVEKGRVNLLARGRNGKKHAITMNLPAFKRFFIKLKNT